MTLILTSIILLRTEAVWLYSNSTSITSISPDVPANKFIKSISPLDNVPNASSEGTIGVLYNRDDSCLATIQQPIPYPFYAATPKQSQVPKIAFIRKQGGNCTLVEKILNAQNEGAIGAIVYDTIIINENHKAVGFFFPRVPPIYNNNIIQSLLFISL
jgi:hypothetical protein